MRQMSLVDQPELSFDMGIVEIHITAKHYKIGFDDGFGHAFEFITVCRECGGYRCEGH